MIALQGPPDVGKSTLARALSAAGLAALDKDDIKDLSMAGRSRQVRSARKSCCGWWGDSASVSVSAIPLARTYEGLRAIAATTDARLLVVYLFLSQRGCLARTRDGTPGAGAGRASHGCWAGVQRFLAQPGAIYEVTDPRLSLDTTKPLDDLVAETLAWLDRLNDEEAGSTE